MVAEGEPRKALGGWGTHREIGAEGEDHVVGASLKCSLSKIPLLPCPDFSMCVYSGPRYVVGKEYFGAFSDHDEYSSLILHQNSASGAFTMPK